MITIFNSFLLVAATEMGDKTQLLAFVLATRFRKPWAIMAGILVATIFNHLLAAIFGQWAAQFHIGRSGGYRSERSARACALRHSKQWFGLSNE